MENQDQATQSKKKFSPIIKLLLVAVAAMVLCPLFSCLWLYFYVKNSLGYIVEGDHVYHATFDEGRGYRKRLIGTIDPKSFDEMSDGKLGYAKDKAHCYFNYKRIRDADVKSFEILQQPKFAKDKEQAYFEGRPIEGVDLQSFEVIGPFLSRDSNHGYYETKHIEKMPLIEKRKIKIDLRSLRGLGGHYWCDSSFVFHKQDQISGIDPATAEFIPVSNKSTVTGGYGYVKDKSSVYRMRNHIKGADPLTFKHIDGPYALDKSNVYYYDKIIKGADPKTFVVDSIFRGTAHDANGRYSWGKPR